MMVASQASLRTVWGGEDLTGQGGPGTSDGSGEPVVSDGDHDLGFGGDRSVAAGCGGPPTQFDEGVGSAPVGLAGVAAPVGLTRVGCAQWVEGGGQDGTGLGVELAADREHAVGQRAQLQ